MKNVVMITLDCVRPDHLGCYGYSGVHTPTIDGLAAHGLICGQAICQAPNTWTSHASIFTGCNPIRHGLHTPYSRLGTEVPMLPEILRSEGYRTAAFPAHNLVGRASGFDRGFDFIREEGFGCASDARQGARWRPDWEKSFEEAARWLRMKDTPFLLWLHYIETHKLPVVDLPEHYRTHFSPKWQFYDGKISYADHHCVRRVLDLLEAIGALENTILVLFSDHGEALPPVGEPAHNDVITDDVMKIALILDSFGTLPFRGRISSQVRSIDIAPTILDILGLEERAGPMDGISMRHLADAVVREPGERTAYMENLPKGHMGLRTEEWKLVLRTSFQGGSEVEVLGIEGLYHHPSDPGESRNLALQEPGVVEELMGHLEQLFDERAVPAETIQAGERSEIERTLQSLGYA